MDSNTLRLILLVLGIALVVGIYLWDRRKHVDSRLFSKRSSRKSRFHDSTVFHQDETPESDERQDSFEEEVIVKTAPRANTVEDTNLSFSFENEADKSEYTDDLSFSATSAFQEFEAGADLPTKIIQVNLVARKTDISGQMILDLASELNLQLGDYNIFHRMDPKTGKSIFSMANIVEPGSFDPDNMQDFKTPGLTIFSQLPAPIDCLKVFSEMMDVAKRISYIVGAEMQDASHSAMTSQSIEHEREAIVAYKQKLQLAMQSL